MTARPPEPHGADPRDPEQILARLPGQFQSTFLAEYQAAADAAAYEVSRYKQLQELLQLWNLRAAAYSRRTLPSDVPPPAAARTSH